MRFAPPFCSAREAHVKMIRLAVAGVFVGTAFVLFFSLVLCFAILPAGEWRAREIPLELVAVSEGTAPVRFSAHEVVVLVGPKGDVRLGGRALSIEALEERLGKLVAEAGDTALTVRADAGAPYGAVAAILAAGRKAGIREASLLTVERPSPPTARGKEGAAR